MEGKNTGKLALNCNSVLTFKKKKKKNVLLFKLKKMFCTIFPGNFQQ